MINYDDTRRDITIDTIPGLRTQSRLIIREPQISDSGNYTCSASNTEPASIYVFVSKGMYTLVVLKFGCFNTGVCLFRNMIFDTFTEFCITSATKPRSRSSRMFSQYLTKQLKCYLRKIKRLQWISHFVFPF